MNKRRNIDTELDVFVPPRFIILSVLLNFCDLAFMMVISVAMQTHLFW
jgi:hypothetical protein